MNLINFEKKIFNYLIYLFDLNGYLEEDIEEVVW